MERVWVFDRLAVSVLRIDFIDPAVAHEPDARERGVRTEVRPVTTDASGSVSRQPSGVRRNSTRAGIPAYSSRATRPVCWSLRRVALSAFF